MRPISIRLRMTIWNTCGFAIVLFCFGVAIYLQLRQTHYDHIDAQLRSRLSLLDANSLTSAPTPEAAIEHWVRAASNGKDRLACAIRASDGNVITSDDKGQLAALIAGAKPNSTEALDSIRLDQHGEFRRLTVLHTQADEAYHLFVIANLEHMNEELSEVVTAIVITVPLALIVAAAVAYFLAKTSLSPMDELSRRTDEITADRLNERLAIYNPSDELGHLTATINSMISRLETSFQDIRRFTGDASHELRTPLAILRSDAELGITEAKASPAVVDRFLSILEECDRLTALTEQLLALCREDAGLEVNRFAEVDIGEIVSRTASALVPLAEAKQIALTTKLDGPAIVRGSADKLRQVVSNLLDNAIKFTPAGGHIEVVVGVTGDKVELEVRDSGIGIPQEHLDRVFDRFYRVESQIESGKGFGLGLSIVKSIIQSHQGNIIVTNHSPRGACFRVVLPKLTS